MKAKRYFVSYRRVQWTTGSTVGEQRTSGATIISEHPLVWAKNYNSNLKGSSYNDIVIPLWWTEDIPKDFDPDNEWEVEA